MVSRQATDAPDARLSSRATSVERSSIRLMFDLAQESDRDDLVHLEIGEPDFDTPDHIIAAASDAATAGKTHYTSNAGLLELREAIADDMAQDGVTVDPRSEILVTTGAMEALHLAMLTVVYPGDDVVVPTPLWPNYRTQVKLADATPVEVPLPPEKGFELDPDPIIDAMSDETAAVVLTSPSNPTGRVYERDAVTDVVKAAVEHDTYVIADEVYKGLVYGDQPTGIAGYVDASDHVLTVSSCSKTYAMTGWRLGWLAGPTAIVEAATKLHESTTACAPSISQHAAIAALTGPQGDVESMHEAFRKRRNYVIDRLDEIPGVSCATPEGAFYAFVDVSSLDASSLEIAKELLYEWGVVTTPGSGFGSVGEGFLRLSFANGLERLEVGLDRFEAFVREGGVK
ncbi:pyridoxal phosphate-dependent aminotransferase [Haladaptatus halobius]|uniref:pyridoxal phosphate-dependent aminotransferase n=1 Tax=Haladaptatus halobius TaxID=2884875 RepID=UPI001D0B05C7|nr:pyridoxal phosphate-dependent aminotransferase [Haladaptatus halobius]